MTTELPFSIRSRVFAGGVKSQCERKPSRSAASTDSKDSEYIIGLLMRHNVAGQARRLIGPGMQRWQDRAVACTSRVRRFLFAFFRWSPIPRSPLDARDEQGG